MSRRLRAVPEARRLSTAEQVTAVFAHRALYELGALIPAKQPVGRPAHHPGYLLLGYGMLARLFRSGVRVQTELADPHLWALVRQVIAGMREQLGEELVPAEGERPPTIDAFRYARDRYLTDPDLQAELQACFTEHAVAQAQMMGLLDADGPGSLCHPDRSRAVYGDGTVVRPLYRPPAAKVHIDKKTGAKTTVYLDEHGKAIPAPAHRFDPDAAEFHGHAGPVHGNNFVALYARGDAAHQRVVLAVDRVDRPGREADTAVAMVKALHQVVGAGMQALVYDGAMRGKHIDDLMTSCGLVVVNKVAAQPLSKKEKADRRGAKAPKWFTLGSWEHDTDHGVCTHALAAVNGAVCEIGLDDAGTPIVLGRLVRRQVKRPRRGTGRYHFNVGYELCCEHGDFLAWVTPHGEPGDISVRRAENLRIIAEGEDDFTRLYGLRNDAESFNSQFKRSLLVDRAMSLGWRRQLLDALCYALLHNAINSYRARLTMPQADNQQELAA